MEENIIGDFNVVIEDEIIYGGNDICYGDVKSEFVGIFFIVIFYDNFDCGYFGFY